MANRFDAPSGACRYEPLIGAGQTTGLAGGFDFLLTLGFEWRDIKRGVISKHSIREVGITPLGASVPSVQ